MSQTTQNPPVTTGEFTAASFTSATETDKHFILTLSNGKERKLAKSFCAVEFTLEQYRQLVLERKEIGPFNFKKTDGTPFEAMLYWIFKPGAREMQSTMGFLEGGQSKFLYLTRIEKGDPNTGETVFDHKFSWRFPSTGGRTLSKKIFEVEISFEEACTIVNNKGSGLTRHDWKSKDGKSTFAATLKWDFEKGTYTKTFVNTKREGAPPRPVAAAPTAGIAIGATIGDDGNGEEPPI